jgi:RNA polymerase sigma factor (sigma-70 family)
MVKAALNSVIRRLVSAQARSGPPDRQLLERFIARKDEAAFATLVERHGAMVLAVARNVLHHLQDAEDVFQATFLVLARKAGSVRKRGSAGSWLHGVAYRLALKARTASATRHRLEGRAPARPPGESPDDLTWRELSAILHEELERLPDRHRAPLVLCYLEGMTQDQAAEQLGLAKGTLRGRLERARLLLRRRLTRRGLAPAVVLLAETYRPAGAALAGSLVSTTTRSAAAFAAGQAANVSVPVAQMTEGVLKAMFQTKLRSAAALLLLAIGLVAATTGVLMARGKPNEPPATGGPSDPARRADEKSGKEGNMEPPWSEAVGGWRIRLTTPSGTEYHRNKPLPLSVELQNASGGPLSLEILAPYADPEVTVDGKRLVARVPIDLSPWEGRRERLPADAILKWTVDFDRLRFATQPLKAGTALKVRFRLAMHGETPDGKPDFAKQRLLFSNEVSLKLGDDHPSLMTREADLSPKWTKSTLLVYRDLQGMLGYDALRIDGEGHAALVTVGHGKGKPIGLTRTDVVLKREQLDRLAKVLREQKIWELTELAREKRDDIANPDEGEIRLSVGSGQGSVVASFADHIVRDQPKLQAFKEEMAKVMAIVKDEAAAKAADPSPTDLSAAQPAWGKPLNGLRLGVYQADPKGDGKPRVTVVLDNVGTDDLVLNLGIMLGNGKKQVPMAVRLVFTDSDGKKHILRRNEPRIAGRVDPFIVPLSVGARYSLISRDLEELIDRLAPGRYHVRAEFVGEAVEKKDVNVDTTGLALMTYWTGTIQSDDLQVMLPAKPAK